MHKIKKKIKEEGAINITAMLIACMTIIGSLVSIIYTNLSGDVSSLKTTVSENTTNIAVLQTKMETIDSIKRALDAKGFRDPKEQYYIATSSVSIKK